MRVRGCVRGFHRSPETGRHLCGQQHDFDDVADRGTLRDHDFHSACSGERGGQLDVDLLKAGKAGRGAEPLDGSGDTAKQNGLVCRRSR